MEKPKCKWNVCFNFFTYFGIAHFIVPIFWVLDANKTAAQITPYFIIGVFLIWYSQKRGSKGQQMTVKEFEAKLRNIKVKNGWNITLELAVHGFWILRVYREEKLLGQTGLTGLEIIIDILEIPFDRSPWV